MIVRYDHALSSEVHAPAHPELAAADGTLEPAAQAVATRPAGANRVAEPRPAEARSGQDATAQRDGRQHCCPPQQSLVALRRRTMERRRELRQGAASEAAQLAWGAACGGSKCAA